MKDTFFAFHGEASDEDRIDQTLQESQVQGEGIITH